MRGSTREFFVGVVFFGLLAVLAVLTISAAGPRFGENHHETFRFTGVAGLKEGDDVWINGLSSGTVKEVAIGADGVVAVRADLKTDLASLDLRADAVLGVRSKSALGGSVVSLETGKGAAKAVLADLRAKVWDTVADPLGLGEALKGIKPHLESLARNLDDMFKDAKGTPAPFGRLLWGKETAEELTALVKQVHSVAGRLDRDRGLGRELLGQKALDSVDEIAESLKRISGDLAGGDAALGRMLWGGETAKKLETAVSDISAFAGRLDASDGGLGRHLLGQATLDSLQKSAANLKKLSEDLTRGDAALGRMLWGGETAKKLDEAVSKIGSIADRLDRGEGTFGKLLKDDSLFGDLRDAIRSITRSSEEARENAPILTFAGFLFRTF